MREGRNEKETFSCIYFYYIIHAVFSLLHEGWSWRCRIFKCFILCAVIFFRDLFILVVFVVFVLCAVIFLRDLFIVLSGYLVEEAALPGSFGTRRSCGQLAVKRRSTQPC
jgi:hypothetical protein